MESARLRTQETVHKHCVLVDKILSHRVLVNNSETIMHVYGIGQLNKWMALEWELIGKQGRG